MTAVEEAIRSFPAMWWWDGGYFGEYRPHCRFCDADNGETVRTNFDPDPCAGFGHRPGCPVPAIEAVRTEGSV
ncbi:hypothetical protein JW921_05990 [Candidatus Fermentibacterales bacterium]|nr:hypothetical protein [Candidatus Fermentibacterales bacterium]